MTAGLFPVPSKRFIPKVYQDDPDVDVLTDEIDKQLIDWYNDIIRIKRYYRPDECPTQFLPELGALLEAGILASDTEFIQRIKIANAVAVHKKRTLFNASVKPILDALTGFDSEIVNFRDNDQWVLTGDGATPLTAFWGVLGANDIDITFGIQLSGGTLDQGSAGFIFIDLHVGVDTAQFTESEIEDIVLQIEDEQTPAYMIVILGYRNSTGQFVIYDGGIIQ